MAKKVKQPFLAVATRIRLEDEKMMALTAHIRPHRSGEPNRARAAVGMGDRA